MVSPSAGSVVLLPFPFSDLSHSKLRPAVVPADAERDDWVLCQVTSKSYTDLAAIKIENSDFSTGSLNLTSYARPGKLFTANSSVPFVKTIESLPASLQNQFVEYLNEFIADIIDN